MTPAEQQALNRRIAVEVMEWPKVRGRRGIFLQPYENGTVKVYIGNRPRYDNFNIWNPYTDSTDALEVLERLRELGMGGHPGRTWRINQAAPGRFHVGFPSREWSWAITDGLHFGPAVCKLARKWLETSDARAKLIPGP